MTSVLLPILTPLCIAKPVCRYHWKSHNGLHLLRPKSLKMNEALIDALFYKYGLLGLKPGLFLNHLEKLMVYW